MMVGNHIDRTGENTLQKDTRTPFTSSWIKWCFYSLLLFIPFTFALSPAEGIDLQLIRVLLPIIVVLWGVCCLFFRRASLGNPFIGALVLSFLFFSGISIAVAQNPAWGVRKFVFLLSFFPLYFVAVDLLRFQSLFVLARVISFSGFLVASLGIVQFFLALLLPIDVILSVFREVVTPFFLGGALGGEVIAHSSWLVNLSGTTVMRAFGVFPDPHVFAFFLGLCLPWPAVLWIKKRNIGYGVSFFTILLALFISFTRGAYVGLLMASLLAGVVWFRSLWKVVSQFHVRYVAFMLIGGIVGVSAVLFVDSPIQQRLLSSFDLSDNSNAGRLVIWQEAVDIILDHPVTGVGLGNYALAVRPEAGYRDPIYAHNLYLDIYAEMGLGAIVVWIVLLGSVGFVLWKRARESVYSWAPFFGLVTFSVHSLFDTALFSVHVLPLLLVTFAVAGRVVEAKDRKPHVILEQKNDLKVSS